MTSTVVLQRMVAATVEELLVQEITPPIFMAENVDGGEEFNKKILSQNQNRIFHLKSD